MHPKRFSFFTHSVMTHIKICCISSPEEAMLAASAGVQALGLVSAMPSGPGVIGDTLIAEIAANIAPPTDTFLLTSRQSADGIIEQLHAARTSVVQIVDELLLGSYADIRAAHPQVKIVQVIHVKGEESIDTALQAAAGADMLLLDSGNPNAAVKTLGGTGNTHNWAISEAICRQSGKPVFLAGGLHAANVQQAIEQVQPFGVDICSGVRTNGRLDVQKLQAFVSAVRGNTR
jgi:phosphoribosylanthranilate isomerase